MPSDRRWVDTVLNHKDRGWPAVAPGTKFIQVPPETPLDELDMIIGFKTPEEIRKTASFLSGLSYTDMGATPPRIFLSTANWARVPEESYYDQKELEPYRVYLINHEVGHAVWKLGHRNEVHPKYRIASIMGQQTKQREWDPHHQLSINPFPKFSPEARGYAKWRLH